MKFFKVQLGHPETMKILLFFQDLHSIPQVVLFGDWNPKSSLKEVISEYKFIHVVIHLSLSHNYDHEFLNVWYCGELITILKSIK